MVEHSLELTNAKEGLVQLTLDLRDLLIAFPEVGHHLADQHEFGLRRLWGSISYLSNHAELMSQHFTIAMMEDDPLAEAARA